MYIVTSDEMRELDRRTIEEVGIPAVALMENVGRAIAEEVIRWCRERRDVSSGSRQGAGSQSESPGDLVPAVQETPRSGWRNRSASIGSSLPARATTAGTAWSRRGTCVKRACASRSFTL